MANATSKTPLLLLIIVVLAGVVAYLLYQESQEDIEIDLPGVEMDGP